MSLENIRIAFHLVFLYVYVATSDATSSHSIMPNIPLKLPASHSIDPTPWEVSNLKICDETIQIVRYLGQGRFSNVFEAVNTTDNTSIAVKVLKPISLDKIKREVSILNALRGTPGVVNLLGVSQNSQSQTINLYFEYLGKDSHSFSHSAAQQHSGTYISENEVRWYMYLLLTALKGCHEKGIIHRDVKPRNILINRKSASLRLIDFGLSEFYKPQMRLNRFVGSPRYKAPELLLGSDMYSPAVDVWAAGCILAGLIFMQEPFFSGQGQNEEMSSIAAVVGSNEIHTLAKKMNIKLDKVLRKSIGSNKMNTPISEFMNSDNRHMCSSNEAIDLVERMLCVDIENRPSAKQCLEHPYFDSIRRQLKY